MFVVSTAQGPRPSRVSESPDPRTRNRRTVSVIFLLLLWGAATALLAVGAQMVSSIGA